MAGPVWPRLASAVPRFTSSFGEVRVDRQGLAVLSDRPVDVALREQQLAQPVVGVGVTAAHRETARSNAARAPARSPLASRATPRLVTGLDVVGLKLQCPAEVGDGLVRFPLAGDYQPQIIVGDPGRVVDGQRVTPDRLAAGEGRATRVGQLAADRQHRGPQEQSA